MRARPILGTRLLVPHLRRTVTRPNLNRFARLLIRLVARELLHLSYTHRIRCALTIARNVTYLMENDEGNKWSMGKDLIRFSPIRLAENHPRRRSGLCRIWGIFLELLQPLVVTW
jgi:hypothetical protein